MTMIADDRPARTRITAELDATLFVEAGAGTGKTHELVQRVTALIATGRLADIRGLAAITFTEAAAGELRDRIRRGLEDAATSGELPDDARQRCRAAIDHLDEAAIATLHGFAQRLLAEFPLEAGLPPGFDVLDAIQAELAFNEGWTAFVDGLLADAATEPALLRAFTLGAHLGDLRDVGRAFHDNWDRLIDRPPPPPGLIPIDVRPILGAVDEVVAAARQVAGSDRLSTRVLDELAPFAERLRAALADDGDPREVLLLVLHELPAIKVGGRVAAGAAEVKVALDALGETCAAVVGDLGDNVLALVADRVAAHTLAEAERRRRTGRLEFHDLLVLALLLLRDRPDVRRALGERIQLLLIDEFQDTDPLQVELAVRLALSDPDSSPPRWSAAEVAPGRLFFVGDPKQSIYRFRRADLGVYEAARERFGPEVVTLTRNHRSVPGVLTWVNAVFTELMQPIPGAQPAFTELAPARPTRADDGPAVLAVGGPHPDVRVGEVREVEAAELAAVIAGLRAGQGYRYADVAVLLPTRASLGAVELGLAGAGIPYRIESRSLVFATDEVAEVLAVLGAVDDPGDEVGIVAALRSPALACSDADLLSWRLAGGGWHHPTEPLEGVAANHPVAVGLARLAAWHDAARWMPVNLLVDLVLRQGGFVELTTVRLRPRDHWRRYRLLLDEARAFVEAGGESLGDFVAWVTQQADEEASRVEAVVPEEDDDAVRILTVHGAKGLEFPVVVLTGLNALPPVRSPRVVWAGDRPELCVGRAAERRVTTHGYAAALDGERRHDDLERIRLLYVAATRARDLLVVGLHHKEGTRCVARQLVELDDRVALPWERIEVEPVAVAVPVAATAPPSTATLAPWAPPAVVPLVVTPTELAHDPHPPRRTAADAARDGAADDSAARAAVGRAVHGVLERVDLHDPAGIGGLARDHATAQGIAERADEVARLARAAWGSEPVRAAAASGRVWREVPVTASVGDRLIEGVVDLLYETADGELVVVDHKTGRARSASSAAARYRLQGAAYAVALEAALDRPVSQVVLVLLRGDEAVARPIDDLAQAKADVIALMGSGGEDSLGPGA